MCEQTAASVALLKRIKKLRPDVVTIIGGANCEGEMAEGIASLTSAIDFIFSGESDVTFPAFLQELRSGHRPAGRILSGKPFTELDRSPTPSFADYFRQFELLLPRCDETSKLWDGIRVPLESGRGCWWGQTHHCTFCGLNRLGMVFREKTSVRLLGEFEQMVAEHPFEMLRTDKLRISMTDSIMPRSYFRTLLPRLQREAPKVSLQYEQKANLSLEQVLAIRAAGIDQIQPGIETLSTSCAKRMRKGVTASQNIDVMRYAVSAKLAINWSLLTHFPGEEAEELRGMLALVPLLRHLAPPGIMAPISIDRFSPYFDHPDDHAVTNVRPIEDYADVLPAHVQARSVAYFFTADYDCASNRHPEIVSRMKEEVAAWRAAWSKKTALPMLSVQRASSVYGASVGTDFVLIDTRGLPGTAPVRPLTRDQASSLLVKRRLTDGESGGWAVDDKLAVVLDGCVVPLATAEPEILLEFEAEDRRERGLAAAASKPETSPALSTRRPRTNS
jgi:ribosomal peptide maturation radical SAM protein 1